jgi:hypothetical protein
MGKKVHRIPPFSSPLAVVHGTDRIVTLRCTKNGSILDDDMTPAPDAETRQGDDDDDDESTRAANLVSLLLARVDDEKKEVPRCVVIFLIGRRNDVKAITTWHATKSSSKNRRTPRRTRMM